MLCCHGSSAVHCEYPYHTYMYVAKHFTQAYIFRNRLRTSRVYLSGRRHVFVAGGEWRSKTLPVGWFHAGPVTYVIGSLSGNRIGLTSTLFSAHCGRLPGWSRRPFFRRKRLAPLLVTCEHHPARRTRRYLNTPKELHIQKTKSFNGLGTLLLYEIPGGLGQSQARYLVKRIILFHQR